MNAPKKIWVDEPDVFIKPITDDDIPYIRADLVDGLVEALEDFLNATGMPDRIKAAQKANDALRSYRGYDNEIDKEGKRLSSVIDAALKEEE